MTWILILTIQLLNGATATSAEFNSKENCEEAIKQVTHYYGNALVRGVCVEKKR